MATTLTNNVTGLTVTLHNEQSEEVGKASNLTAIPLYSLDSTKTEVFDFGGVTRKFDITATEIDTPANLIIFAANLDSLQNGAQDPTNGFPLVYHSPTRRNGAAPAGDVYIKVLDVKTTHLGGVPRKLMYTISCIEAAPTG